MEPCLHFHIRIHGEVLLFLPGRSRTENVAWVRERGLPVLITAASMLSGPQGKGGKCDLAAWHASRPAWLAGWLLLVVIETYPYWTSSSIQQACIPATDCSTARCLEPNSQRLHFITELKTKFGHAFVLDILSKSVNILQNSCSELTGTVPLR
jgi:hypothetical protein